MEKGSGGSCGKMNEFVSRIMSPESCHVEQICVVVQWKRVSVVVVVKVNGFMRRMSSREVCI